MKAWLLRWLRHREPQESAAVFKGLMQAARQDIERGGEVKGAIRKFEHGICGGDGDPHAQRVERQT